MFALAVQLTHLFVDQVFHGVDLCLHLLLGGLQLVLQFTEQWVTAAAIQWSLQHNTHTHTLTGIQQTCSLNASSVS